MKRSINKRFKENKRFRFLRKKEAKKETKEWASPMNIFIRFAEAFASMHVSGSNYLSNKLYCPAKSSHLSLPTAVTHLLMASMFITKYMVRAGL